MKTNRLVLRKCAAMLALIVSAAFMLEACAKEPVEGIGMITMTTKASKVAFIAAGTEDITIDWGDGKKSNEKDAIIDGISDWRHFSHDYFDATVHNIVITGNFRLLACSGNQLTAFDVTNNTALTMLACQNNTLDAEALNALFGTLHSNPGSKSIRIFGNPGTSDCHSNIAEDKGWGVVYIGMLYAIRAKIF